MQYLMDYEDKKFQNVSKEGLKLGKDSKLKDLKESFKELTDWWKKALESENVDSMKISNRLHNTPCVVVTSMYGWSANMEKIMQAQTLSDSSKQAYMRGKRVLEINPRHPHHQGALRQGRPGQRERGLEADGEAGVPDCLDGEWVQPP